MPKRRFIKSVAHKPPKPKKVTRRALVPDLCAHHRKQLIYYTGFMDNEPWQQMMGNIQVGLFTAVLGDNDLCIKLDKNPYNIHTLGCLACIKEKEFNELVDAGKFKNLDAVIKLTANWREEINRRGSIHDDKDKSD